MVVTGKDTDPNPGWNHSSLDGTDSEGVVYRPRVKALSGRAESDNRSSEAMTLITEHAAVKPAAQQLYDRVDALASQCLLRMGLSVLATAFLHSGL
jgi:hypothetical protein